MSLQPKPRGLRVVPACLAAIAVWCLPTPSAPGYEAPDPGKALFSADGIFLSAEERSGLLEALAAIASNFSVNSRVDDDLREKALAIALTLDPLHHHSRAAHHELLLGATPKPTSFFNSLASVSETLWSLGTRLAEPPHDPEEKRLSPLLLELSLLTHPEPPADRLATFARLADRTAPEWEPVVKLQKDRNPSTVRAHDLFQESLDRYRDERRAAAVAAKGTGPAPLPGMVVPGAPPGPANPGGTKPPRPIPRTEIEPIVVTLPAVCQVSAVESTPVSGTVTLTVRAPRNSFEREWLAGHNPGNFPLIGSEEDIPLNEFALPLSALPARAEAWPIGAIGEVRFSPLSQIPGPRRLTRAQPLLPTLVLLESALAGSAISQAYSLVGDLDPTSLQLVPPPDLRAAIEIAAGLGKPFILAPTATIEELVTRAQITGDLAFLFRSDLIACEDTTTVVARLNAPVDPALEAAAAVFDEIEAVSKREDPAQRMTLADLARNSAAQEKLRAILATYPDHLSARVMLEFGTRPLPPGLLLTRFVSRVDSIVEPFLPLEEHDDDLFGMKEKLEGTKTQFLRLRTEAPPETRDLVGAAEDLVAAAEAFLLTTNKTTSMGAQKLRETRDAISTYKTERVKFGPAPKSSTTPALNSGF